VRVAFETPSAEDSESASEARWLSEPSQLLSVSALVRDCSSSSAKLLIVSRITLRLLNSARATRETGRH
jgi:hypothetical protein